MTYYLTPYDKRGLGHAYNEVCRIVPKSDDFICLQDGDIMLLTPRWGELIENAVNANAQFDLYTCYATRIYPKSQQQYPKGREERDLVKLKSAAVECAGRGGTKVRQITVGFSGFFLLFRKRLWEEIPFATVGTKGHRNLGIDTDWCNRLRAAGKKVGLIEGLLAVHFYRLDTGDADKAHLA